MMFSNSYEECPSLKMSQVCWCWQNVKIETNIRSLYLENSEAHIWKTEELIFGKLSSSSYVPRNRDQHLNLWTQFKLCTPCCLWLCSMPPLCCKGLLTLEASQIEWRLSSWTGFGRRKRWRGRGWVLSGVGQAGAVYLSTKHPPSTGAASTAGFPKHRPAYQADHLKTISKNLKYFYT